MLRPRTPEQLWFASRWLQARGYVRLARITKAANFLLHKALLPAEASVGKHLILEHYALGVVIHPQVIIGDDCRIYHHVTLAAETRIGSPHRIVIGDRVTIGAHSIVVARRDTSLTIGDDSVVAAGAVVTRDVPSGEIWAGNPARKLRDHVK